MATQKEITREKIILATISCIEKVGFQSVTTRVIAQEAGVNSAAINYYFGSKEQLLDLVFKQTLEEAFIRNVAELPYAEGPRRVMHELCLGLLEGALRYPGIARAHFLPALSNRNYQGVLFTQINAFINNLVNYLRENQDKFPGNNTELSVIQIISAIILPGILPDMYSDFDFQQPENRNKYVSHLLEKYFEQN